MATRGTSTGILSHRPGMTPIRPLSTNVMRIFSAEMYISNALSDKFPPQAPSNNKTACQDAGSFLNLKNYTSVMVKTVQNCSPRSVSGEAAVVATSAQKAAPTNPLPRLNQAPTPPLPFQNP